MQGGFLRRVHLFEIHEQAWLPDSLRGAVTLPSCPKSLKSMPRKVINGNSGKRLPVSGTSHVVDLCSGAGGPWLWMQERLASQKTPVDVWLTDKYPNATALRTIQKRTNRGFHRFPPEEARALVRQAEKLHFPLETTHTSARSWDQRVPRCAPANSTRNTRLRPGGAWRRRTRQDPSR